jgi:uncharacterized membrane protein
LYRTTNHPSTGAIEPILFVMKAWRSILLSNGSVTVASLAITLAAVGLYIAVYFTLVYYGVLEPGTTLMPRVCRLDERTCQTVLSTRFARVFGVPNSRLGVLYYACVITLLSTGWITPTFGAALVAVA